MRLDEILDALPDVGLELWMLTQTAPHAWSAQVHDPLHPITTREEGLGTTPLAAMIAACTAAGVDVTDE